MKGTLKKIRRQGTDKNKIFTMNVSNRALDPKYIKKSYNSKSFPGGSDDKESSCNAGDPGSIPGLGRSPEGNGNPIQYFCLENSMDRGAWQATVLGVTKSQTQLSDFTFGFHFLSSPIHDKTLNNADIDRKYLK